MNSDVERFLDIDNRVTVWPKKQKDKEVVIAYLAGKFDFGQSYHETTVNEMLKQWHTFSDWALLRRELFERGYLNRNRSGTEYIRRK
jgi:hypothetical protein